MRFGNLYIPNDVCILEAPSRESDSEQRVKETEDKVGLEEDSQTNPSINF